MSLGEHKHHDLGWTCESVDKRLKSLETLLATERDRFGKIETELKAEIQSILKSDREGIKAEKAAMAVVCKQYEKLESENKRLREALENARKGFDHLGGYLASYGDKDMGLYGLKGFAFDRRNEIYEALAGESAVNGGAGE